MVAENFGGLQCTAARAPISASRFVRGIVLCFTYDAAFRLLLRGAPRLIFDRIHKCVLYGFVRLELLAAEQPLVAMFASRP